MPSPESFPSGEPTDEKAPVEAPETSTETGTDDSEVMGEKERKTYEERGEKTLEAKKATATEKATKSELEKAIEKGGTTIRSYANAFLEEGSFQFFLQVYGKTGEKCGRCGTPIEKIVVGQRGTHYCPNCQVMKK